MKNYDTSEEFLKIGAKDCLNTLISFMSLFEIWLLFFSNLIFFFYIILHYKKEKKRNYIIKGKDA